MDILEEHYDEYISRLYEKSCKIVKRDTSVCFYDCSNYYFETETDDEDYVDEVTGEFIKGLRKYGPSKEHRPNPIAQMGLFMDRDGIPLSMCITSGSDNEQTTAIPLETKLTKMFKGKKFIYCADAGLGSLNIRSFNSMGGRAFIVTQSIKKLSEQLKQAVFSDCDYRLLSTDKPASINSMKSFDRFDEKNISLYNDRIYKIIPADKAFDLGLYEEKVCKNGVVKKVKYDGFYAVATNLEDSAKDVLVVSENRYKIENCFRVMKTNLSARPVFHQKRNRIIEHFMICYTALLIYRLLEKKLDNYGTHFTIDNTIETLKNMNVANLEDMCYMSTYTSSDLCTALNAITGLGLDKKYYEPKELNKKIRNILK